MADNAEFMAELLNREPNPDPLRAALVAIQELHGRDTYGCCLHCHASDGWSVKFPCQTRRLADDALGGDRG